MSLKKTRNVVRTGVGREKKRNRHGRLEILLPVFQSTKRGGRLDFGGASSHKPYFRFQGGTGYRSPRSSVPRRALRGRRDERTRATPSGYSAGDLTGNGLNSPPSARAARDITKPVRPWMSNSSTRSRGWRGQGGPCYVRKGRSICRPHVPAILTSQGKVGLRFMPRRIAAQILIAARGDGPANGQQPGKKKNNRQWDSRNVEEIWGQRRCGRPNLLARSEAHSNLGIGTGP